MIALLYMGESLLEQVTALSDDASNHPLLRFPACYQL
jgi:hypothetical protein